MAVGDKQRELNEQYRVLEDMAKGQRCVTCHGDIWPAWNRGEWALRCKDGFNPDMEKRPSYLAERLAQLAQDNQPEVRDIMLPQSQAPAVMPEQPTMTIEQFKQRQDLIKYVVGEMIEGVHYGQIPGTSDRGLWEPGAEYLRAAFNIQWSHRLIAQTEDHATGDYQYRYYAFQLLAPGVEGAGWEASAWSKERRFWCKGGDDGCPKTGCPQDHEPSMERQMLPHNVADRALKRAFVAMIRNVTGTTGYFKEGMEDGLDDVKGEDDPNDTRHDWLKNCPEHGTKWFQSERMREPAHRVGNGWCNQSIVLKPRIDKMLADASANMERQHLNNWLKGRFGKTWSGLNTAQKLEAVNALAELKAGAEYGEAQGEDAPPLDGPEQAPMNVDTETGEIQD